MLYKPSTLKLIMERPLEKFEILLRKALSVPKGKMYTWSQSKDSDILRGSADTPSWATSRLSTPQELDCFCAAAVADPYSDSQNCPTLRGWARTR